MKRKRLSKNEIKKLNKNIEQSFGLTDFIDKKDKAEIFDDNIVVVNDEPSFFYYENKLVPTLKLVMKKEILKKVVVDMPAVPFMVKGADVMRPGIKELEDFEKGAFIMIVDETHKKPLAIGLALFSSENIKAMDKGRIVKNLHWVGDKVWSIQLITL
ncbi:hypothetical protein A3K72_00145 [Candidatus Woesearchaeota archaeon RBG_13_36_6]|nr:MAG: hypothetical protein A3K72_00145 [Candidatus Woesearchaeota archaeon RBG_13_36_6]